MLLQAAALVSLVLGPVGAWVHPGVFITQPQLSFIKVACERVLLWTAVVVQVPQ